MRGRLVIAVVAVLALPAAAFPQERPAAGEEQAAAQARERLEARLGPEDVRRVEETVDRAARRGVPRRPLLDKALEGAAKGVPADRILAALEAYAGRLDRSSGLVGAPAGTDAVEAGADALARGVPADEIRRVARSVPADRRAVPLVVLGDLVEIGVPAGRAADVVAEAVRSARSPDEMLQIPARVRGMVRRGIPPGQAAGRVPGPPPGAGPPAGGPPGAGGGPPVPPGSGPPEDPGGQGSGGGSSGGGSGPAAGG